MMGKGCAKCSLEKSSQNRKITYTEFISRCNKKHNAKYRYFQYDEFMDVKIKIECPHHGNFYQMGKIHMRGSGCQKCANLKSGGQREKFSGLPTTLYYISINELFFKIGITTLPISERFKQDIRNGTNIRIIEEKIFEFGEIAYDEEQRLLNKHKSFAYIGENILISGNSEIFTKNVLNI